MSLPFRSRASDVPKLRFQCSWTTNILPHLLLPFSHTLLLFLSSLLPHLFFTGTFFCCLSKYKYSSGRTKLAVNFHYSKFSLISLKGGKVVSQSLHPTTEKMRGGISPPVQFWLIDSLFPPWPWGRALPSCVSRPYG